MRTTSVFLSVAAGCLCLVFSTGAQAIDWTIQTVDSDGQVGMETSLVLNGSDQPRISYLDWTNMDLKYAA